MADYEQTKQNLLKQSACGNLRGVPLNGSRKRKGWMAIRPCICVEAEGCPCDTLDDVIVWVPAGLDSVSTGKKCEGHEVLSYDIDDDEKIFVEAHLPVTVGQLHRAKRLAETGERHTRIVFHKTPDAAGKLSIRALITGAFELGWQIGEEVDGKIPLSERVWNWLAQKLPWPRRSDRSRPARSKSIVHIQPGTES